MAKGQVVEQEVDEKEFEQLKADVQDLLNTTFGRRFIWQLLEMTHVNSVSFTGNSQTFFLEGERSIGIQILQLLEEADPKAYPKLILENIDRS